MASLLGIRHVTHQIEKVLQNLIGMSPSEEPLSGSYRESGKNRIWGLEGVCRSISNGDLSNHCFQKVRMYILVDVAMVIFMIFWIHECRGWAPDPRGASPPPP